MKKISSYVICGAAVAYFTVGSYCTNSECHGFEHNPHEPISQSRGYAGYGYSPNTTSGTAVASGTTALSGTVTTLFKYFPEGSTDLDFFLLTG